MVDTKALLGGTVDVLKKVFWLSLRHFRSTANINMAVKTALLFIFAFTSIFWFGMTYFFLAAVISFVIAEFDYKSTLYFVFFVGWLDVFTRFGTATLPATILFVVSIFLSISICITKIILEREELELKKFLVPACFSLPLLLMAFIPPFGVFEFSFILIGGVSVSLLACIAGHKLGFTRLVLYFSIGLALSSFVGLIFNYFRHTETLIYFYGRFSGLLRNPNILQFIALLGICGLYALVLSQQLKRRYAVPILSVLIVFGLMASSRAFAIVFLVISLVSIGIYLKLEKNSRQKYTTLGVGICAFLVVFFALHQFTFPAIERIFNTISFELNAFFRDLYYIVLDPTAFHDPGRLGLWRRYLQAWLESPRTFFLGHGINAPYLGQVMPHNLFVDALFKTGIVGFMALGAFIAGIMYALYKVRGYKVTFIPYLFVIAIILISLVDTAYPIPVVMFALFVLCVTSQGKVHSSESAKAVTDTPQKPQDSE
ncbi:MAG: O-antigen ligase family protein [Firmicutes bacterium]|nr:O-antigen ligase family protein [Bacillota bacterium]